MGRKRPSNPCWLINCPNVLRNLCKKKKQARNKTLFHWRCQRSAVSQNGPERELQLRNASADDVVIQLITPEWLRRFASIQCSGNKLCSVIVNYFPRAQLISIHFLGGQLFAHHFPPTFAVGTARPIDISVNVWHGWNVQSHRHSVVFSPSRFSHTQFTRPLTTTGYTFATCTYLHESKIKRAQWTCSIPWLCVGKIPFLWCLFKWMDAQLLCCDKNTILPGARIYLIV